MPDRAMIDRIKSLLENKKRQLMATHGPDNAGFSHTTEDHPATHIQPVVRTGTGVVFPVDNVVPASDPLWLGTLRESVEIRTDASILIMPDQDIPAIAPEGYFTKPAAEGPRMPWRLAMRTIPEPRLHPPSHVLARAQRFLHPLVQAVHIAFSDHRPLVLTPDCIWLTIVQGFAHHVLENAESLRRRLVRHEGKKKLCIKTNSLSPDLWPSFMSGFSGLIREHSDPVLHETLLCEFSTTTPAIKTACEIALMDTYQRYFSYELHCVCGIPEITLEGTVEDWQRIRDRIEVLATYDIDWWTSRLAPILDQFVATAKGEPDRAFWQPSTNLRRPMERNLPPDGLVIFSRTCSQLRGQISLLKGNVWDCVTRQHAAAITSCSRLEPTGCSHRLRIIFLRAGEYCLSICRVGSPAFRSSCNFPIAPRPGLR
jgi:Domain of unknown function (DUF4419)